MTKTEPDTPTAQVLVVDDEPDHAEVMAEALRLPRRIVIPLPVLTPRLSSLWIHLVTPLSAHIARPLPHYRSRSFVVFDGSRAIKRGLWPARESPLVRRFEQ